VTVAGVGGRSTTSAVSGSRGGGYTPSPQDFSPIRSMFGQSVVSLGPLGDLPSSSAFMTSSGALKSRLMTSSGGLEARLYNSLLMAMPSPASSFLHKISSII